LEDNMTKARDIMSPNPEILSIDTTVAEAARKMAQEDLGAAPVCNSEGRLQGMITDRDIVTKVIAAGKDPNGTTVGEIAGKDEVVTIGADDSLEEAIRTMKDHKVRRLPVIDGTKVVGMVSQGDVAQHLPPDKVGELVEAISSAP
jgi:CBS domain-containing protein